MKLKTLTRNGRVYGIMVSGHAEDGVKCACASCLMQLFECGLRNFFKPKIFSLRSYEADGGYKCVTIDDESAAEFEPFVLSVVDALCEVCDETE